MIAGRDCYQQSGEVGARRGHGRVRVHSEWEGSLDLTHRAIADQQRSGLEAARSTTKPDRWKPQGPLNPACCVTADQQGAGLTAARHSKETGPVEPNRAEA